MENRGGNFRQIEQYVWEKQLSVPLWNQIERFLPLAILGNEPRISPRSMVHECDKANESVILRSFR